MVTRGHRSKRRRLPGNGLFAVRRSIESRIVEMILDQLDPYQRELLAATAGNPQIEAKLERLVKALVKADIRLNLHTFEEELEARMK